MDVRPEVGIVVCSSGGVKGGCCKGIPRSAVGGMSCRLRRFARRWRCATGSSEICMVLVGGVACSWGKDAREGVCLRRW